MKVNLPVLVLSIAGAAVFVVGLTALSVKLFSPKEQLVPISKNISSQYSNITASNLKDIIESKREIFLLDVHIPEQEHISSTDGFIPYNKLANYEGRLPQDKDTEIIVYCRSGNMSETASQTLVNMGYSNVKNLVGGIKAWKAEGYSL
jgi:rhodanese-related sulfurtransferase